MSSLFDAVLLSLVRTTDPSMDKGDLPDGNLTVAYLPSAKTRLSLKTDALILQDGSDPERNNVR